MTTETPKTADPIPLLSDSRLPAIIARLTEAVGIVTPAEAAILKMQGIAIIRVHSEILLALAGAALERRVGTEALAAGPFTDADTDAALERAAQVLPAGLRLVAETMPTAASKVQP